MFYGFFMGLWPITWTIVYRCYKIVCKITAVDYFVVTVFMAAAGAERGPRRREAIVDVVLPADALAELHVSFRTLCKLCDNGDVVLRWLAQHGLIHNTLQCAHCNISMSLQARRGGKLALIGFTGPGRLVVD